MNKTVFKRKIYDKILDWKESSAGDSALLVQGARRIGKSTIVREFARNEYDTYIFLDFSNIPKEVRELFKDIYDLDYFFMSLQVLTKVELHERKSVIVFDEVQLEPLARQAIKHLVADGRYDYIETGSLISIKKNVKDILIPSEEHRINMFPMDYEEFSWALGDELSSKMVKEFFENKKPLGEALNRKLMRDFRLYMLVGGMPQAVNEYIETKNFKKVDAVKRKILQLYEDDFRKIDSTGRSVLIFRSIPAQLNSNASSYKISSIDENTRLDRNYDILQEMIESMTVNISYHINDPNVGFYLSRDVDKFKLFIADTGLFVTLAFMDKDFTENIIYEKLLSDKLPANLGYVYENVVAQMLKAAENELMYYTMKDKSKKHNYEIDFIISRKNKICPIEVKSSSYKAHKSLDVFRQKYSSRILKNYLIYTKDCKREDGVTYLPAYMVPFI